MATPMLSAPTIAPNKVATAAAPALHGNNPMRARAADKAAISKAIAPKKRCRKRISMQSRQIAIQSASTTSPLAARVSAVA